MKYSLKWVEEGMRSGSKPEFLFFWGHTPKVKNAVDKSCFSQWWISAFEVNGIIYKTAEHWMMANKALLFKDDENYNLIIQSQTAAEAKKLGRRVKNFDVQVWQSNASRIVIDGNFHKFSQHNDLKNFLLQTGNAVIVEASPVDTVWGVGLAPGDPDINDPSKWKGTNLLGFALMEVRDILNEN